MVYAPLMLRWRWVSCESNAVFANLFAYEGCQNIGYGLMLLHSPLIIQDARPKIIDAPLTTTSSRW